MNYCIPLCVIFLILSNFCLSQEKIQQKDKFPMVLVIHGGAGTITKNSMTPEMEQAYREKLAEALRESYQILQRGGTSLDAVERAIVIMEDSPLFNAGKGAVFTNNGHNELDASIMDGKTLNAGAIAGVRHLKNPIQVARLVMEKSRHVMLTGEGAETFAQQLGIEMVPQKYFYTEKRWQSLQKIKEQEEKPSTTISEDQKHGTVGAVALDQYGNLAAGTSTGGMTNKRFGRVGDSPIVGAGTYADNKSCAVSCTGHGEYFIRLAIAHSIAAAMEYKGLSVQQAAQLVIMKKLTKLGGTGGIIAVDAQGEIAMVFNTEGMYRGYIDKQGKMVVEIYKE